MSFTSSKRHITIKERFGNPDKRAQGVATIAIAHRSFAHKDGVTSLNWATKVNSSVGLTSTAKHKRCIRELPTVLQDKAYSFPFVHTLSFGPNFVHNKTQGNSVCPGVSVCPNIGTTLESGNVHEAPFALNDRIVAFHMVGKKIENQRMAHSIRWLD